MHPFFVKGQGWTPAGELRVEDLLATDLCSWMEVENITASNDFTSADLVFAFQNNAYEAAATARLLFEQIAATLLASDRHETGPKAAAKKDPDTSPLEAVFAELSRPTVFFR